MEPLVSVVIPTHNRANLLRETLLSAQTQSYENLEIIVADDAGTDNTEDVVRSATSIDGRVRYVRAERNGGVGAARNLGYSHSKGEFIQYLDSDDLIHREKIAVQLRAIEQNPGTEASACQTVHFKNRLGDMPFVWNTFEGEDFLDRFTVGNLVWPTGAMVLSREAVERCGLFEESLMPSEDLNWFIRHLALGLKVVLVRQALHYYRRHGSEQQSEAGRLKLALMNGRAFAHATAEIRRRERLTPRLQARLASAAAFAGCASVLLEDFASARTVFSESEKAFAGLPEAEAFREARNALDCPPDSPSAITGVFLSAGIPLPDRKDWWFCCRTCDEKLEPVVTSRRYARQAKG
jgi:GT2 family glycosyltransferase